MHRQSSYAGYEHAARSGTADFLECDVTVTSDGVLICAHSPDLGRVGTIAERKLKARTLEPFLVDDSNGLASSTAILDDWMIPDYPWSVIKHVSAACPTLNPTCEGVKRERLARVKDLIQLAIKHSTLQRPVGLYLEIKHQMWHASQRNIDLILPLIALLEEYVDLDNLPFPIHLQTFEYPDLVRIRRRIGFDTDVCVVALIDDVVGADHPPEVADSVEGLRMMCAMWQKVDGDCGVGDCDCLGQGSMATVQGLARQVSNYQWKDECPRYVGDTGHIFYTWADEYGQQDQCEVASRECHAHLSSFWTTNDRNVDLTCLADVVAPSLGVLRKYPRLARTLTDRGVVVHAWTLNTPKDIREAVLEHGVTGIITDDAQLAYQVLRNL